MMKRTFRAVAAVVVTLSACHLVTLSSAHAQEPYGEDMRFVRELRSRGYSDLAREYLQKLAQNAPAELKKELPLEIALTNLEAANEEPDSSKRLSLYAQARAECEKFLKDNPSNPRAAEARLEIARATTLQGKTQLSRALLEEDGPTRLAEGLKARATLVEAFNQLKQLPSTPETELARGLNLFDQAQTYLNTGSDKELLERGKKLQEANKVLEKVAEGSANDKITWQARAWVARCIQELGEPKKARDKYLEITDVTNPAAQDGKRLARYFILLAAKETKEAPGKRPVEGYIVERASDWLRDYRGSYGKTPEGHGVRYLLAEMLLAESENPKLTRPERDALIARARQNLREVESSENDFTDRAKRLKIAAMDKQGLFKNRIDTLKTFEDCFVRAQYEQMQIGEDAKKYKDDPDKLKKSRQEHIDAILQALQSGLKKPDVPQSATPELNNVCVLLAYYLLEEGKYKEAIEVGEGFARREPKYSQAAAAAVYALLAYGQMISQRERNASDPKALQGDKQFQDDKEHMLELAKYMEVRWPKERAGDFARHEIALRLLREEKFPEAIEKLAAITPAYPSYIRTQYALAHACLQQAEQEKDKNVSGGYRTRAFTALSALPDPPVDADVETNRDYIQAKATLARELAKEKKFTELDALMKALLPKVGTLRLVDDPTKDKELRSKMADSLVQLALYSTASQADADFKGARYTAVTKRLDPIVNDFLADKLPQLKESGMAAAVFGLDLKANVQLNNIERAKVTIKALQALQAEKGGENNTTAVLSQLVGLIAQQVEELRKKGDKDNLKKAQDGFTSILNEVAGGQKKPTPKLALLLAKCYAGMDEHRKAAELLKPFAIQPTGDGAEAALQRAIQLLLVQELRETKETDKAKLLLDEIMGSREKPGWGAKSLDAQELRVILMEDEGQYGTAALLCDRFVTQLVRRLDDNKLKEYYFKFYYHLVYCIYKNGQGLENNEQKAKAIKDAAQRIVTLRKRQGGFGSEESRKRFEELLEKEPELREQYNALKDAP
jgi:hypothetical protein